MNMVTWDAIKEMQPGELRELFRRGSQHLYTHFNPEDISTHLDEMRHMMKTWVEGLTPEQEEKLYRFFALWQCALDICFNYSGGALTAEKAMEALDMATHIGGTFRPPGALVDHLLVYINVGVSQNKQEPEVESISLDGKYTVAPLNRVLNPKHLEHTRLLISNLSIDGDLADLCKDGSISAQRADYLKLKVTLLQRGYQKVLQIVENLSAPAPVNP